jgi:tryptophan halogenase
MQTNLIIVGGGSAGYITALILKSKFQEKINIKIIKSSAIGIIGVGEGSTEHWSDFLSFTGIDKNLMVKECGATYKFGIMFKEWGNKNYLHSTEGDLNVKKGPEDIAALNLILNNKKLNHKFLYENKLPDHFEPNQYHFDTHKLNIFLEKISKERNIEIVDDIIEDVIVNNKGIDYITSKKEKYDADFFIDCTGFKRLLMNKLGAKWKSYKKYLKVNSAITFQTQEEENYNCWTLAKAMKFGWRFKIPVQGRNGNGYIFSDKYTTPEKAKIEVEKELGYKIKVGKHIKFNPGRLDKVWIKNCVAVGLSANFVEPLEATSIGTSIQQAYLLMHNFANPGVSIRQQYNNQIESIMENIKDFIYIHYINSNKNNLFWKNYSYSKAPTNVKQMLDLWERRLPIDDDIKGSDYKLFWSSHFIQVLYGIGFYKNNKFVKKQYSFLPEEIKNQLQNYLDNILNKKYANLIYKTHKEIIKNINK